MVSKAELSFCRSLRPILDDLEDDSTISDSEGFRRALCALEFFLPQVLREIHPEWNWEGLDGILPTTARKTGAREVEIFGLCILITDQTLAPLHLRLRLSTSCDAVSWLELRLGEKGREHRMRRIPYSSLDTTIKRFYALDGGVAAIDWVYAVTVGERRP